MSVQVLTFYWLPHCTTCQKAARYLEDSGYQIASYRDIKNSPLKRAEVENLASLVGGAGELFSRRARKYREMNLSDTILSSEEMIGLMAGEYTFIKRPVLASSVAALAGFTPKTYDGFLQNK